MGSYFLDTSAIVKRYFPEQGHNWIVNLCDQAQGNKIYISQAALVEVVSSICRKAREQGIINVERDMLIDQFRQDSVDAYFIVPVTTSVYTSAGNLCRSHRLRAYDAVQLSCVLTIRTESLLNQVPSPTFICADLGLIDIAMVEGLSVENPNNYS